MAERSVTIGLIQLACAADPAANLETAVARVAEAAGRGAQLIALPELFRSRYFCQTEDRRFFQLAEPIPGPTTERLSREARRHQVVLVASLFESAGESFYNTAVVIDADGKLLGKYRKMHIPDDLKNFYGEAFYFRPGDLGFPVFATRYAKIGVMVCWDQWFPEGARRMALAGAEVIFYPTAIGRQVADRSGWNEAEREAWQVIQRSHAIANGVFVAACNRVGCEDHLDFWGTSFVADPLGQVLARAADRQEETLVVACNLSRIAETRKDWPFHHALRKDAY